ncbi:MAG TPA: LacI family DNA-binding transcriptional regulator [Acidimicrobiales bacterium]|nr:LacI family DNA-binding transcriptional regulator [Acidimicrobiales bacterium]
MTVTSEDVARLAGVSRATVSRIFNSSATVSPQLRKRVEQAAHTLGYEPDMAARSLVSQRSRTIVFGLFSRGEWTFARLADPGWYFYLDVLREIEAETRAAGYDLLLPSQPRQDGGLGYVRSLTARRVAGAIVAGCRPADPRIPSLIESGIPTTFVDVPAAGPHASYVASNNEDGAFRITEHVIGLGHRDIAVLTGDGGDVPAITRLAGMRRAFAAYRVPERHEMVTFTDWTTEAGAEATRRWLDDGLRFTAIIAHSDMLAIGAVRALHERGVRVPDEVSVTGFDDIDLSRYVDPPLTTIRQDPSAMGSWAARTLVEMIATDGPAPEPMIIPTELVVRQSTGPVPRRSRSAAAKQPARAGTAGGRSTGARSARKR